MSRTPRRPAQLDADQIEAIEGDSDVAYNSELAHTSAQALVPLGRSRAEQDLEAVKRIIALVDDEGVDVLAEIWVRSPEDTLPGILWRGYLLREWIRRNGRAVSDRYNKVVSLMKSQGSDGELKISMTPKPGTVLNSGMPRRWLPKGCSSKWPYGAGALFSPHEGRGQDLTK